MPCPKILDCCLLDETRAYFLFFSFWVSWIVLSMLYRFTGIWNSTCHALQIHRDMKLYLPCFTDSQGYETLLAMLYRFTGIWNSTCHALQIYRNMKLYFPCFTDLQGYETLLAMLYRFTGIWSDHSV